MYYIKKGIKTLRQDGIIVFIRKLHLHFLYKFKKKTEYHFVQSYRRYVRNLIKAYPIDEAMSMAVGDGNYYEIGTIEKNILLNYGLKPYMNIVDYGCGSGRLAHALPTDYNLNYLGVDIIDELIDYAKTKTPSNYKYIINHKLNVPVESDTIDIVCAFSLFTHLLHEESFIYMADMKRALKKGGKLIFTFLEFGNSGHWSIFAERVETQKRTNTTPILDVFIEKSVIMLWAEKLGLKIIELKSNQGQSLAVLEKE